MDEEKGILDNLYDAYAAVTHDSMLVRHKFPDMMKNAIKNKGMRMSMVPATMATAWQLPNTPEMLVPKAAFYGTGLLNAFSGLSDLGTVADSLYNGYKMLKGTDDTYDYKNNDIYQDDNYRYANGGRGGF